MRPEDWPRLLDEYVDRARAKPFAWGTHDCISFTCGWYTAMTGCNPFAPFAGKYDSETAAFRVMHGKGVHMMEEAGDYLFEVAFRKPVEFAQRGDIVLAENALGVSLGNRGAFLTVEGLGFVLSHKFQIAWSV
jgi:hypothetical protein